MVLYVAKGIMVIKTMLILMDGSYPLMKGI